ncbi:LPXTG cell wall anchor domain-containing protein [Enterococcus sp. AZ126]|uniref:LPXTG cell wall anchor domain-containing protein n=1 Tax=Enterococcus sp. AZ126 TaxID=2774635 RepID=UPI003F29F3B2
MNDVKKQLFLSIILIFSFSSSFTMIVQAKEAHAVSAASQSNASIIITTPNQKDTENNENHHTEETDMYRKPKGRLNQKKNFGKLPNTGEYSSLLGKIVGSTLLIVVIVFFLNRKQIQQNFKKLNLSNE